MPSVYLTRRNEGNALPSFVSRKIGHLAPGDIAEVPIVVTPPTTFMYPLELFRMALTCILTHTVAYLSPAAFNLFKPITVNRLFEVPVSTFRFQNLSPEEIASLKALGLQQDLTNPMLFVGTPLISQLGTIARLLPVEDRIRPGHISYSAWYSYTFLMKGINAFLTARNNFDGTSNMKYQLKKSVKFSQKGDIRTIGNETIEGKMTYGDQHRSIITTGEHYIIPGETNLSAFAGNYIDIENAKQAGPTTGFFFPYFHGLNQPSKTLAGDVFMELFRGCCGPTHPQSALVANKVRKGNRALSFSRTGMVLSHIYRCMSLSLEIPGCRMAILLKGHTYLGVVMEADENTTITVYGEVFTAGDITEDVKGLDLLESQAKEIVGLTNSVVDIDGKQAYNFIEDDFMSSRRALRSFNSLDQTLFSMGDQIPVIKEILGKMEFGDTFPIPTVDLISTCLSFCVSGEYALLSSFPAFLGGGVLESDSRFFESFSMFGPRIPSCNTAAKGTVITIPGADKADANLVRVNGVRPLHYLPMWVVPIGVGVAQWEKVIKSGTIVIPSGRRGKKEFTDLHRVLLQVSQDDKLVPMYNNIRTLVNEARAVGGLGKRKRGSENQESSKGKKAKVTEEFDMY